MLLGDRVAMSVTEYDTSALVRGYLGSCVDKSRWNRSVVDPGFHCILPSANAKASISDILCLFASRSTGLNTVEYYLLPAYRRRFRKPLLKMPEDDVVFIFGCSPSFCKGQEEECLAIVGASRSAYKTGMGSTTQSATPCLAGWIGCGTMRTRGLLSKDSSGNAIRIIF